MIVKNSSVVLNGNVCIKTTQGRRIFDDISLLEDISLFMISFHKSSFRICRYGC
ncbi:hypothetical protein C2G38_2054482, partial [Gigaspora rosea]